MLDELTRKIDGALKKIRGQGKLTEANISDALREIRRALLDADVNYKVAKRFVARVKEKSLGAEVMRSITPSQLITKHIHDELTELLGGEAAELRLNASGATAILVVGLQGSGKTTFSGKLAKRLKERGGKPGLVACDVYRPAAIEQLKKLGESIDVPVLTSDEKDPRRIATSAPAFAKERKLDALIYDTAGRLHVDEEMMAEVADIKAIVDPNETLFVVDSMTGQDAVNSAKAFNERVDYDGVVLTKLDGDSRGGCALSIREVVGKPIKFASVGETLDALEPFHPDRLASRILDRGDVVTFVEKAQAHADELESEELEEKLRKNAFDFEDFLKQIKVIKKMGSLSSILAMIPGASKLGAAADVDDDALVKVEAIVNSMTREERREPKLLNGSRRKRIARGSGSTIQDVNRLLKRFKEMKRMMGGIAKSGLPKTFPKGPSPF
ncbi:MAG: signal recognition particle protein [Ignavibacteriales bacterium]|nr:signal recognition particle protein [Ignavibacteriales bacterium]